MVMGIYDRDYYQQEEVPQRTRAARTLQRASVTNKLLIANVAVYLGCWLFSSGSVERTKAIYDALSIGNDYFTRPWEIWRWITYGFMHSPFWAESGSIWHLVFNGFMLWMFGRFVEQRYGSAEFLRFYLLAIVFSGLVFVITNLGVGSSQAVGASGGVVAIVILFCFLYPHEKLLIYGIFPVPAWLFGIVVVGLDILTGIGESKGIGSRIAWQAHLGGAGFAAAYYLMNWNFSFLGGIFSGRKPRLSVYRADSSKSAAADEPSAESQLIAQGEEILQKVHEYGESSLTARQRKMLERYSELMQKRRGRDDDQYRF